jgi:TetR/AcrR family transcriptional regulator, transcriptional repressor for nem operon
MSNIAPTMELPETKRKLVDAGVKLMRIKGFHATSVDEICSAAGVTKGGFFHYFKSKEDLAHTAVNHFRMLRRARFAEAPFRKLADPLDRVFGRLDFTKELFESGTPITDGCLVGMFAQEVAYTNPELRSLCEDSLQHSAQDFEQDLAEAKAQYAPKGDFDPKKLALMYVSIYQGSKMMAKALDSQNVLTDNLDQFRYCLENLFGRKAGRKPNQKAGRSKI